LVRHGKGALKEKSHGAWGAHGFFKVAHLWRIWRSNKWHATAGVLPSVATLAFLNNRGKKYMNGPAELF
jgi:hypothetical protein